MVQMYWLLSEMNSSGPLMYHYNILVVFQSMKSFSRDLGTLIDLVDMLQMVHLALCLSAGFFLAYVRWTSMSNYDVWAYFHLWGKIFRNENT